MVAVLIAVFAGELVWSERDARMQRDRGRRAGA
jgi:hypothetical protein